MEEYIIFIGIAFWLVYFSTTIENDWLKLLLKLYATLVVVVTSYIPLSVVSLADKAGLYDLFAYGVMWAMIFFWIIWFIVLFYELLLFFIEKRKSKLEGTQ